MDPFQLTQDAVFDIDAIWLYLLEKEGVETADRIVTELFKGFYKLAEVPNSGHRRADLTSRKVLFCRIFSYLIIYQPGSRPLQIPRGPTRKAKHIASSEGMVSRHRPHDLKSIPIQENVPARDTEIVDAARRNYSPQSFR